MKPIQLSRLLFFALALSCSKEEPVPAPVITSFSPTFGPLGTEITITGSNFANSPDGNKVRINGALVTVISSSPGSLTVRADHGISTGKVTVEAHNQVVESDDKFLLSCHLLQETTIFYDYTYTSSFTYSENRLVMKTTSEPLDNEDRVTYEYDGYGRLSGQITEANGYLLSHLHYDYDNANRIVGVINEANITISTYQYNSFGQLAELQGIPNMQTGIYQYPNTSTLNPSVETLSDAAGTILSTTHYEYDSNPNPHFIVMPWLPYQAQNNYTKIWSSSGATTHTYTYNSSGYPSTSVVTITSGATVTISWIYDCD